MQCLVDVSQSRTERSSPQEAMSRPSGENLQHGKDKNDKMHNTQLASQVSYCSQVSILYPVIVDI